MRTYEIKKGTCFETADGTLLQVKSIGIGCCTFKEYEYNMTSNEYDILIDDNRILTTEEIKVELYRSFGKNYKIRLIEN